ncbi:MAG: hypothetical protein HY903_12565 [Deltaproteobacteria bacterium]|nr:hypothetical protein [Deltaproteobacteria bacterium]
MRNPVITTALAAVVAAAGLMSCSNDGGEVLGASGVDLAALSTCQVPCQTAADCQKIVPKRDGGRLAELPFVWQCENNVCVDYECLSTADCANHYIPDRSGVPCNPTYRQCAPACGAGGACPDIRDQCINGACIRQPEPPNPACQGPGCECYSDAECRDWVSCRTNICWAYQSATGSAAAGRRCGTAAECGAKYMVQDMLEAGLSPHALFMGWGMCGDQACQTSSPSSCGAGFSCAAVTMVPALTPHDSRLARTACLPDGCKASATCAPSLKECVQDADCESGEGCMTVWGGCPGVCLDVTCSACRAWLDLHHSRTCTMANIGVPIAVRRPD